MQANKNTSLRRSQRIKLYSTGFLTLAIMVFIFIMSARDAEDSSRLSSGFLTTLIGAFLARFLPQLSDKGLEYDIRKYAHMFEYFCLAVSSLLFFRELYVRKLRRGLRAVFSALLLCFVYACSDEWHQTFVPGRSGRFSDVMVDLAGSLFGLLFMLLLLATIRAIRRKKTALRKAND